MLGSIVKKVFGSSNDRELKRIEKTYIEAINGLEPEIEALSESDLKAKTGYFRQKLEDGATLDEILPEAFAVVREASRRTLGMRHFDVQLVGGVALHQGRIAEMKTGEGKTLMATLPVYLNALAGKGVHVVTVNDYLARRDSEWMGAIYRYLGMEVGVVQHGLNDEERQWAYNCDITYATNNELGFDYLRDNMKLSLEQLVQRELNYAIVDEVDSILIDEARTPLIISGPAESSTEKYYTINKLIPKLISDEGNYTIDEKAKSASLTEDGIGLAEKELGIDNLYDATEIDTLHHVHCALKAHLLFKLDVDYMIKDDQVVIVDEFTGRLMPGRRWSDGLHQAVEAKEGVKIENENQTLATITFQNYFRIYNKLSGMTGTADTEAAEFANIYNLDVLVIPTNVDMARLDFIDQIYMTGREKYQAIVDEIERCHKSGQPTLVGTVSIEKSEKISAMLKRRGVKHNVLNAKQHEREAEIVAQAGRAGSVTIATNMAGRGTDIVLGGNAEMMLKASGAMVDDDDYEERLNELKIRCANEREETLTAGGLHIIGTERHESRRIDNQLRGRSGRQGDPGSSRFFLSLEDDLLRIFGSDKLTSLMDKLGMEEGEPIEAKMVTKAIENAQKKVEGHNYDMRKHLLEYDDVMNNQRTVIYEQRQLIFAGDDQHETILDMAAQTLEEDMELSTPENETPEEWDVTALKDSVDRHFGIEVKVDEEKNIDIDGTRFDFESVTFEPLFQKLRDTVIARIEEKRTSVGEEQWNEIEKYITLNIVDSAWKDHLLTMDHLKEGVGLRGYAQKNPLHEYKREGMDLFNTMMHRIRESAISSLYHVKIENPEEARLHERYLAKREQARQKMVESHGGDAPEKKTVKRETRKVGRNEPCPCGSGKKYKKCHGAIAEKNN